MKQGSNVGPTMILFTPEISRGAIMLDKIIVDFMPRCLGSNENVALRR
jgi:hypothetical protein